MALTSHPTHRYDVFCAVRDDEGSHWRTLSQLLQRGDADCMLMSRAPSPHEAGTLVNLVQRDETDAPEGCEVGATLEVSPHEP